MPPELPVIRTKTLIPRRRSEILSRPRLLAALDNMLDLKLLIVAAPAGYGKTSLLVDFSHHTQVPVCWYALDPLDNDLKRFIAHFIAAIQGKFSAFGQMALAALSDLSQDRMNLDPVISAIVNDAYENISEHFIFVLDDYHLVRDVKPIEVFINRIIQESAENCHFVIASRTLLTLPDLSLLVARSQVDGLSFEELAFLPEEIKQLMAVNYHQAISDQKAEELITRTEGWITGLLLTAQLSPKGPYERSRIEKVSGVGIYEYLTQQVFDRQTLAMQSFLLRTSLLEEFDASLCERIVGKALGLEGQNWDEVIEKIQRDNLFVLPVGDETLFLRYHHLFRDFLQNRMRVERADETHRIETELALYYESVSEWERAISILLRIGTPNQVVEMVRKAAPSMILSGRLVTLTDWLNALPGNLVESKPELVSIRGTIAMLRGDHKASLELLDEAIRDLRNAGSTEELAAALIRRSAINRHLGHYENALKDSQDAIELTRPPFGAPQKYAEALRAEGLVYFQTGELADALWKLRESYRRFQDLGMESDAAKVLLDLGVVYSARADFDQSEKCYTSSLEYWQAVQNPLWLANVLNNIGMIQYLRSQFEQAVITLERSLSYSRLASPRMQGYVLTSLGDLYRDVRALKEARQAYNQAVEVLQKTSDLSLDVYLTLALANLDRITGYLSAAQERVSEALTKAQKSGSKFEYNLCQLEQAILDLKNEKQSDLENTFKRLEDYFTAAGYQLEGFKASVFRNLATQVEPGSPALKPVLDPGILKSGGSMRQVLIQALLEFGKLLEMMDPEDARYPAVQLLLGEVAAFEKHLPQIHRVVRRHSSAVDFANPRLSIRGFGRMQVRLGNRLITNKDWKTHTVRDLFFFLLSHPEGVTKEEIGAAFWPDADRDTVKLRFKNSIYRLRKAAGRDCVAFDNEIYRFNRSIDYDYDVDTFMFELENARKAQGSEEEIEHYRAAVASYHGPLLPKIDQEWVLIAREKQQTAFLNAAQTLINLYMKSGKYQQAAALANRALEEDNYNESVYRSAMMAYSAMDDRPAVARQFEKCKLVLKKELDIEPSPQTIKLYNSLMRQ
ncbi:MAG TPA: BTAD domain-containing putative transcriptional regulator [Anaerolineaceae bacterium]|nr:BTAD domain-containing putative transcriptional regulator [Anaerolineaceae bacterium]